MNPLKSLPQILGHWSRGHQTNHGSNRVNESEVVAGQVVREIFQEGEHDSRRCQNGNGSPLLDHGQVDEELPAGPMRIDQGRERRCTH